MLMWAWACFANVQHIVPAIGGDNDVGTYVLHRSLIRGRLWLDKVLNVVVTEHFVDDNVLNSHKLTPNFCISDKRWN